MKHSHTREPLPFLGEIPPTSTCRDPSRPITDAGDRASHTLARARTLTLTLTDAQLTALADGMRIPLCEVGTWIPGPPDCPAPVRREHSRRVRTADFLAFPYPLRIEAAPGFRVSGFDGTGAPLDTLDTLDGTEGRPALTVPADTPFVLVIAAEEEPTGRLTPADAARYAAAVRIPTRTAADIASVAESLAFVSTSMLSAVSAVAEAEQMLADRVTSLLDGVFSPVCVPGRWVPQDGALLGEDDRRCARTSSCLAFGYDAEVLCADGFRVTAYAPDGEFCGGWSGPFRIPAETKVCFNIERIGADPDEELSPADAARAVRILTRPMMEISRIDARVRDLEERIRAGQCPGMGGGLPDADLHTA